MIRALAVIATAVVAATVAFARTHSPPDPQQQAQGDGCERNDTTLHTLQSPNWGVNSALLQPPGMRPLGTPSSNQNGFAYSGALLVPRLR